MACNVELFASSIARERLPSSSSGRPAISCRNFVTCHELHLPSISEIYLKAHRSQPSSNRPNMAGQFALQQSPGFGGQSFSPGDRVRLCGLLQHPQLNGLTGTLLGYNAASARWQVKLDEDGPAVAAAAAAAAVLVNPDAHESKPMEVNGSDHADCPPVWGDGCMGHEKMEKSDECVDSIQSMRASPELRVQVPATNGAQPAGGQNRSGRKTAGAKYGISGSHKTSGRKAAGAKVIGPECQRSARKTAGTKVSITNTRQKTTGNKVMTALSPRSGKALKHQKCSGVLKRPSSSHVAAEERAKESLMFDISAFKEVSSRGLQVDVQGKWRSARLFKPQNGEDRIVIWYGDQVFEGLWPCKPYMLSGVSPSELWNGECPGQLYDGDGERIPTRFDPAALECAA